MLSDDTIKGLRLSRRKDIEAARVLDRAASFVDRGWTQCTDAVSSRGVKVPAHSRRARCWCMLGALRAALVSCGLARLVDHGDPCPVMVPSDFGTSVMERALWMAATAILGRFPKLHASTATIVTQWNDTTAMSGETVARKLRDARVLIERRIADVTEALSE